MSNGATARRGAVVLVVLDGWGFRRGADGNAIELARSPTWHKLWETLPRTLLEASGLAVGLPEGQMGNSEVGHLNLGAGRVVNQDIVRVSDAIESRRVLREPGAAQALRRRQAARRHAAPLRPDRRRRRARARPAPASPASTWRSGSRCRGSRSTPCSTGATRRRSRPRVTCATLRRRPRGAARAVATRDRAATSGWTATSGGTASSWPTTR